jgi:putative FmdB family regulatory protein
MPVYAYRCHDCGLVTDQLASVADAQDRVVCEHCGSKESHRIISRVAYHSSEASKTARLDPKYEKMADQAMKKSESADVDRLLKKMKPFPSRS